MGEKTVILQSDVTVSVACCKLYLCTQDYDRSKHINIFSICQLATSFPYIQSPSGQYWTI